MNNIIQSVSHIKFTSQCIQKLYHFNQFNQINISFIFRTLQITFNMVRGTKRKRPAIGRKAKRSKITPSVDNNILNDEALFNSNSSNAQKHTITEDILTDKPFLDKESTKHCKTNKKERLGLVENIKRAVKAMIHSSQLMHQMTHILIFLN